MKQAEFHQFFVEKAISLYGHSIVFWNSYMIMLYYTIFYFIQRQLTEVEKEPLHSDWKFLEIGKLVLVCSSTLSFTHAAHLFICSALLAMLMRSTALIRALSLSFVCFGALGKVVHWLWVECVDFIQGQLTVKWKRRKQSPSLFY